MARCAREAPEVVCPQTQEHRIVAGAFRGHLACPQKRLSGTSTNNPKGVSGLASYELTQPNRNPGGPNGSGLMELVEDHAVPEEELQQRVAHGAGALASDSEAEKKTDFHLLKLVWKKTNTNVQW